VAIILLDAKFGLENQDQKIIQEAVRRRKGIILAVNKWDLIKKETNTAKKFADEIKEKLGSIDYVTIKFISALNKQRIYKLIDLAKSLNAERKKKISTSALNDIILPEVQKHPPPATGTGKVVTIKFITQVGEHYPIFLVFSNLPNEIPDNYRRFLERLIRKHFGFEGVPMTVSFKEK
jgi:GTP-binding protein